MLVFPARLFKPQSFKPRLVGGSVTGGQSLGGASQYGDLSGGGLWSIEFGPSTLWDREQMLTWWAMEAALTNGATPIVVPIVDRRHQPVNFALTTTPFDDTTLWDDDVAWDQAEVDAVVTVAAALRATTLIFSYSGPKALVGGELLSILHAGNKGWRMHRVTRIDDLSAGVYTVQIRPPLRAAVDVDTPLNFDTPRVVCRAVGDVGAGLESHRFGEGQAAFVECFPPSLPD